MGRLVSRGFIVCGAHLPADVFFLAAQRLFERSAACYCSTFFYSAQHPSINSRELALPAALDALHINVRARGLLSAP